MTKLRIKGTQKQQTTNAVIEKQLFDKFRYEDNQGSDSTHINLSFAVVLPE